MADSPSCTLKCYPLRLFPGQEVRTSLQDFVKARNLKGAFILSCVGSITKAQLRLADSVTIKNFEGLFEIVSLVGTLSGGGHLHISLSNENGDVFGGHVYGNLIVHTTAEVVIGDCYGAKFERQPDNETGYRELVVSKDVRGTEQMYQYL